VDSLREAGAADDPARDLLHQRCFGFAPPRGMWAWKYRENPQGRAIELVAEEAGAVVAAFALQPRRFLFRGEEALVFQAADAMTAPEARRRGCFARALAEAEARAREQGGELLFAFGGAQSVGSFARAGWRELRQQRIARRALGRWCRLDALARDATRFEEVPLVAALELAGAEDRSRTAGRRDRAWLAWRLRAPRFKAFAAQSGAGAIAELCAGRAVLTELFPAGVWEREPALWRGICAALRARGAESLEMTRLEDEPLAARAAAAGLRPPRREPLRPLLGKELAPRGRAAAFAAAELWLRDLDRDAEGLLLRAACSEGPRA
jgi:predicted N-acetyltransferase YhbS